jgi:hypothetical protein
MCVRRVWLRQMGLGENAGLRERRVGKWKLGTGLCSGFDAGVSAEDGGGPYSRPGWSGRAEGRDFALKRFDWLS